MGLCGWSLYICVFNSQKLIWGTIKCMKVVLKNVCLMTLTGEYILYKSVSMNLTVSELGPFPFSSLDISPLSHLSAGSSQPFTSGGILSKELKISAFLVPLPFPENCSPRKMWANWVQRMTMESQNIWR